MKRISAEPTVIIKEEKSAIEKIKELGELKEQGPLSEDEFEDAKKKLLEIV